MYKYLDIPIRPTYTKPSVGFHPAFKIWWEENKPTGVHYAEQSLRHIAYSAWLSGMHQQACEQLRLESQDQFLKTYGIHVHGSIEI